MGKGKRLRQIRRWRHRDDEEFGIAYEDIPAMLSMLGTPRAERGLPYSEMDEAEEKVLAVVAGFALTQMLDEDPDQLARMLVGPEEPDAYKQPEMVIESAQALVEAGALRRWSTECMAALDTLVGADRYWYFFIVPPDVE